MRILSKFIYLFSLFVVSLSWSVPGMTFEVENVSGYLIVKKPMVGVAVVPHLERVGEQDKWGQPFPLLFHQGKYYLQAEKSKPFGLDFQVGENARFLFVTTIDGINIVGGRHDLQGYVAEPAKFAGDNTVAGWRFHQATIQRFVFTEEKQSLAALIGHHDEAQQQEIGIISVSVFAEHLPIKQTSGKSRGLGTGPGEQVNAPVESTQFEKGELVARFVIHYTEQLPQENPPQE